MNQSKRADKQPAQTTSEVTLNVERREPDCRYKLKRLTINLPQYVFDEIQALSKKSHQPMGILMRNAYALAQLYYDEQEDGNSLAIIDSDGKVIKDIFMP